MNKQTKGTIFFFFFIVVIFTGAMYNTYTHKEGYTNAAYVLGDYPSSQDGPILPSSMFPHTGSKTTSTCTANMIWRNYPEFQVGSYAQETNNIRHPRNPDEGTCMPADFCGALYKNRKYESNVVTPMGPVKENTNEARVNYYRSKSENMLPYYNNGNILY